MALASILFLATGILVDLAQPNRSMLSYASLGLILGVGFLAKSAMLPLSLVYILAAAFACCAFKRPDWRALVVLAGFLLVSTPFAIALSRVKGRPTFGDTGKVAYIDQVLRIPLVGTGAPKLDHHPIKLFDDPPVYAYVTPFHSTYPAWYDPSYWFEAFHPHFVLRDQRRVLAQSLTGYFGLISTQKQWIAGWLALAFLAGDWRKVLAHFFRIWFVWMPSIVALALYALVLVEPRYVAVGLTVVCLTLFAAVLWSRVDLARNFGMAVVFAVCATSGLAIAKDALMNLALCVRPSPHVQWQVAQAALKMGLSPGDQVAVLGHTTVADYWAHLGGFIVIADIPLEAEHSYWLAPPAIREQITFRLRAQGIRALVSAGSPLAPANWRAIGDTGYYVEVFDPIVGAGSTSVGTEP